MKKVSLITTGLFLILALAIVLNSCKKSTDYLPAPYACNCGSFKWFGTNYPLLNSAYILSDSTEALSRRYYITADTKLEGEDSTHAVSMTLDIADASELVFILDNTHDEFDAMIDEFNVNDIILPGRHFVPVSGTVQVNPAILGGTESVTFNMTLKESFEGTLIGQDIPFSGNFKVQIEI